MAIATRPRPTFSSSVNHIPPSKTDEMQSFPYPGPIQLPTRFTTLKETLTSGKGPALVSSWQRLLRALPEEIDLVSSLGSQAIPTIPFTSITDAPRADRFLADLQRRGVGIIRNVVPRDVALSWSRETGEYLDENQQARPRPAGHPQLQEVYWSAAQVSARAHPNLLAAQRFAMGIWKSRDPCARVTGNFPITYADRLRARAGGTATFTGTAHVDGGSVERWEPDGYGRAGTYQAIFEGRWEDYDPWEVRVSRFSSTGLFHRSLH